MAGGNRAVIILRIPIELKVIASCYQSDKRMLSLNAAVVHLLETHPELVELAETLYPVTSRPVVRKE